MKRIAVTGAAGQIAYSLLFRIAHGDFLGSEPVALHLLDLPEVEGVLKGVKMELDDCAFPLLKEVRFGSSDEAMFEGIDYAFLVGSKPRGPGMERKDLLQDNGKIFVKQGKALNKYASKQAKILVVGNPCNTNCLIALHNAPDLKRENFHAMTRLDQNRATFQLANKANVDVKEVSDVIIWGNHSSTMVPDFVHAKIKGKPLTLDRNWLEKEFVSIVQKRGAEVINARGKSSAASAANAATCAFADIVKGDKVISSAVYSAGNPYGIDPDLIFSFPYKQGIVKGWEWDLFLKEKIALTQKELIEERDLVRGLLS